MGLGQLVSRPLPSAAPDHYTILGLDRRCTAAQIRAAYRVLAKLHHPDVHGGAADAVRRAQELNAAHEVLGDPARRRAYDRERAAEEKPAAPLRAGRIERNIAQDAPLRIEEFLHGTELEVRVQDPANPQGAEIYPLTVPPGTAPGTRFRLARAVPFEGGWVVVRVKVRPGFRFKARGSDLRCDLRIDARRATQGGPEWMPGPAGGLLRVAIPSGVARGETVRVSGEGLPRPRGGRGDLLVRITYRPEVRITRGAGR